MSETTRRMLVRGVAAAKAGDQAEARRYLERLLYLDASRDQQIDAHWWLFNLSDGLAEQRDHLEEILACDPTHAEARRELAIIDGDLDPDDIIDPDRLPESSSQESQGAREVRRFVCPQCGGRMAFDPGSQRLRCGYCGHRTTILSAMQEGLAIEERDFVIAMATLEGHTVPQGVKTLRCQGCQAELLSPDNLTAQCPYCGSSHMIEAVSQAQILPEGLIPFAVKARTANRRLADWLRGTLRGRPSRVARVRGLYLPLWTFDLIGEVKWRAVENSDRGGRLSLSGTRDTALFQGGRRVYEGVHSFLVDDTRVPASHLLPHRLCEAFTTFEFDCVVPYDAAYLADQPAVRYDVTVSDASLLARRQVLETARRNARIQAEIRMRDVHHFQVTPTNLAVQSYKLLLVPLWLGNYRLDGESYVVLVNGQTAEIVGERSPGRIRKLLGNWFGV
jgi:DNA-directed RNA polymerase subunit RPC12/RpoP